MRGPLDCSGEFGSCFEFFTTNGRLEEVPL